MWADLVTWPWFTMSLWKRHFHVSVPKLQYISLYVGDFLKQFFSSTFKLTQHYATHIKFCFTVYGNPLMWAAKCQSESREVKSSNENEYIHKQQYILTHPHTILQTNLDLPKIWESFTKQLNILTRKLGQNLASTKSFPYSSSRQSFQPRGWLAFTTPCQSLRA